MKPRDPIMIEGDTTFHFVTDGLHAALERARDAAGTVWPSKSAAAFDGPPVPAGQPDRRDALRVQG